MACHIAPSNSWIGRRRANLRPDALENPEALVPLVLWERLVESQARTTRMPDLGLIATGHVHPLRLGTYRHLMPGSGTLDRAIETRAHPDIGDFSGRVGLCGKYVGTRNETASTVSERP